MFRHTTPLDVLKQQALQRRIVSRPSPVAGIEPMEARRLLSVSLDDETLQITGTAGNDVISLTRSGADDVIVQLNGSSSVFDLDDIDEILILGGSGGDRITFGDGFAPFDMALQANGGPGNDSIVGGNNIELLFGEAGDDTIRGNAGTDQISGGDGNDSIAGGTGDDTIQGDANNDSIDAGDGNDEVTGNDGNDTVIGGAGFDILDGGAGTDSVVGNAADDSLFNGENPGGDDNTVSIDAGGIIRIVGTPRKDGVSAVQDGGLITISFGRAQKAFPEGQVNGVHADLGAGNDFISLSPSNPASQFQPPATLLGGDGDDEISGSGNADQISGGNGNDLLRGEWGNDSVTGGAGDDTLDGGEGIDTLAGGAGFNAFFFGEVNSGGTFLPGLSLDLSGNLRFDGSDADDDLVIWRVSDSRFAIWINGAQQTLWFFGQIDLFGNGGNDELRINSSVTRLSSIQGGAGNDTLSGGGANDRIFGGAGDDRLIGNAGSDSLIGEAGNDTLEGGAHNDSFLGGEGRDTVDYSGRTAKLVISLNDEADDGEIGEHDFVFDDVERVLGGSGNDRFVGNADANTFFGRGGNDTMDGMGGADALHGEGGDDLLIGGTGDDFVDGGSGADFLSGREGADTLLGQSGNDTLFANDGFADTVNGGSNADTATVDGIDSVTNVETLA